MTVAAGSTILASDFTCLSCIPKPAGAPVGTLENPRTISSNTVLRVGLVVVPFQITVNKVTIISGSTVTTPGTFDLTLYSEDGQTQLFSVTTASVSAVDTIYTTAVSAVNLRPGNYYIAINSNGTTNAIVEFWDTGTPTGHWTDTVSYLSDVASEPVYAGTVVISAGAPPATITPTTITEGYEEIVIIRLDN